MTLNNYILLAEDDLDDCFLFREALDDLNLKIDLQIVHDGVQLLDFLTATSVPPRMLFLDLNMPKKNGLDSMREIKQSPALRDIPVVVFSTSHYEPEVEFMFSHGAQFYIKKPSAFSKLKGLIETAIMMSDNMRGMKVSREQFVLK
jgi:CheY-like chemotaxis protein